MSIRDLTEGYKPSRNADSSFDPLKGKYEVVVERLEVGYPKDADKTPGNVDRYKITMKVEKTVSGDKGDNRLFFKTYWKADGEKIKQMLLDLFTMGVDLKRDFDTDEEFESQFASAVGVRGHVSAYWFKPEKTMQGVPIPEDERKKLQIVKVYHPEAKAEEKTAEVSF